MTRLSIQKYKQQKVNQVQNADPYELIKIVFNNITGKLTTACMCIERKDYEQKGILISDSLTLVAALQEALDLEQGGEISANLHALYDYMMRTLFKGNLENDVAALEEVINLVSEIRSGWEAIPADVKDDYLSRKAS